MGLNPNIWGPYGWFFIHSVALNYPTNPTIKDKNNYKIFFESLSYILPCNMCSEHYKSYINEHPIDNFLNDNISLNKWTMEMHNNVNRLNNKKEIDYKEYIDIYRSIYTDNYNLNYKYLIILIIICIIIYITYNNSTYLKSLINL